MSKLDITNESIVYGSSDGGRHLHCSKACLPVVPLLQDICKNLNLKPHWIPCLNEAFRKRSQEYKSWGLFLKTLEKDITQGLANTIFMYGPGDLEIHYFKNLYCVCD